MDEKIAQLEATVSALTEAVKHLAARLGSQAVCDVFNCLDRAKAIPVAKDSE